MTSDITFESNILAAYRKIEDKRRICQGDVFNGLILSTYAGNQPPVMEGAQQKQTQVYEMGMLPYFVVLSQDCDLDGDYETRFKKTKEGKLEKDMIINILVCPIYDKNSIRQGSHIGNVSRKPINGTTRDQIKINNHTRYHLLPEVTTLDPFKNDSMVVDFKDYYTIPTDLLYNSMDNYLFTIEELFREHLSQRFASYLSRIGLPNIV